MGSVVYCPRLRHSTIEYMNKKTALKVFIFLVLLGVAIWIGVSLGKKSPLPVVPAPTPISQPTPTPVFQQIESKKQTYQITYVASLQEYAIVVYASPFEPARQEAERAFLTKLGISEKEACGLRVSVSTPPFVNPKEGGKTYRLSFCAEPGPAP